MSYKAEKEAEEAEVLGEKLGLDGSADGLQNMILQRAKQRQASSDDFFKHLESKYGSEEKKTKGKTTKGKKK